ncbi:uncharacterized protein LOC62_04G006409 [Vanrija pseudolonga]|uniref:Uncharacterized protein n=1 Tax=Vanrija pseudolonga TaxID=143232 RepID=A0AAF0YFM8_9TREE|nr:hypothetical protein LOC62_04G006409 [Vanrija pseudolonga]
MSACNAQNPLTAKGMAPPIEPVKQAIAVLRKFYYGDAGANRGVEQNADGTVTLNFYDEGPREGARTLFAVRYTPESEALEKHRTDLAERLALQAKLAESVEV